MELDALNSRLSKLKLNEGSNTEEKTKILKDLTHILEKEDNTETQCKQLIESGVITNLTDGLNAHNDDIHECTAKLLAEIAKHEDARSVCVEAEVIPPLLQLIKHDVSPVTIQACRALGNICFDNDDARQAVDAASGVKVVCDCLQRHKATPGEHGHKLRRVLCGVLLNLTNSNETIQDKAILEGAIETLDYYLKACASDESTLQMALLCLNSLQDTDLGKSRITECGVAVTVVQLLNTHCVEDLHHTIFDVLNNVAENDAVKIQFCQTSVVEGLMAVISKYESNTQDEDALSIVKNATDLLNTMLTGDESMDTLFANGKGKLYGTAVDWLSCDHNTLRTAGALAVGNFARKDTHCVHLVSEGVHTKLIHALKAGGENSPNLQHAVFSALRNLAIPAENKSVLVKSGILDDIVPLTYEAEFTPVIFKMLGTLRMLVDSKESAAATQLGTNQQFLAKVTQWCTNEEHAGVKGESNRLIAWIVRHTGQSAVMETVAKAGGVPYLCTMMHCEHAVMQNEALVALTLMATSVLDEVTQAFVDGELVPAVKVVLSDQHTLCEILCNACTLISCIAKSKELLELVRLADIPPMIKSLQQNDDPQLKNLAKQVYSAIK